MSKLIILYQILFQIFWKHFWWGCLKSKMQSKNSLKWVFVKICRYFKCSKNRTWFIAFELLVQNFWKFYSLNQNFKLNSMKQSKFFIINGMFQRNLKIKILFFEFIFDFEQPHQKDFWKFWFFRFFRNKEFFGISIEINLFGKVFSAIYFLFSRELSLR